MIEVQVKLLHPNAKVPAKSEGNIGWDLCCVADEDFRHNGDFKHTNLTCFTLYPGERHIFHTGLSMAVTPGYATLLWDRSGLSAKNGIHRLAGVIDSSYRGEWLVCLVNLGAEPVQIFEGDRIIQAIFQKEIPATMVQVEELDVTARGAGGFGSSGR
jgi:dUTP pyrophosphatase